MSKSSFSYKDAGVDVSAGNAFVKQIGALTKRTKRDEVLTDLGGFASLCRLPQNYQEPLLVSATDGVGTKLKIANALNQHTTIGIDLVAMCVNDILACGAEPLFFLDYFSTGQLEPAIAVDVVKGITEGCLLAGCALVGGETAEMPGFYPKGEYDLAGFSVGVVEKSKLLDGKKLIKPGDVILGIASSGVHANGFSLVRKILEAKNIPLNQELEGKTLGEHLLAPTQIYVNPLLSLCQEGKINGLAHITGGGLLENIPRVLPENCMAELDLSNIERPVIMNWLEVEGNLSTDEMARTFNCGLGLVVMLNEQHEQSVLAALKSAELKAWRIGQVTEAQNQQQVVLQS